MSHRPLIVSLQVEAEARMYCTELFLLRDNYWADTFNRHLQNAHFFQMAERQQEFSLWKRLSEMHLRSAQQIRTLIELVSQAEGKLRKAGYC
jgi:hypothetical protein